MNKKACKAIKKIVKVLTPVYKNKNRDLEKEVKRAYNNSNKNQKTLIKKNPFVIFNGILN